MVEGAANSVVMAALDAAIHDALRLFLDGRVKPGHDIVTTLGSAFKSRHCHG